MSLSRFSGSPFQLAYLKELTRQGLKPLSRYEGGLDDAGLTLLRSVGLVTETVERKTRFGRSVFETVFSTGNRYAEFYARRFSGTRLTHSPEMIRLEGQLFGYPSCCVEAFAEKPYTPNDLAPSDQAILFHWACPGCVVTPSLLIDYRRVHSECAKLHAPIPLVQRGDGSALARAAGRMAASIAIVAGATGLASADDPHWLPAPDDADGDFLSFAEEVLRGTSFYYEDSDGDTVPDGVQLSLRLHQLIVDPPPGVVVEEHPVWGVEQCHVCGGETNMGFVRVINTARGLSQDVTFMALHFLEHGCLQYDGTIHQGRTEFERLKRILLPVDPAHLLPPEGDDPDADGLLSEEEPILGTDPGDPDSDGDSLPDGPQILEELLPLIAALPREPVPDAPYLLEGQMDGVEQCEVCGLTFDMGHVDIINPLEEIMVSTSFVGLHTHGHGGLVYQGTHADGRLMPTVLKSVLLGSGNSHWVLVEGDSDGDGLADYEEPYFGLDESDPDQDDNGIPDGRQLAALMSTIIHGLPEGPLEDQTYIVHHAAYGFYNCLTCGEPVNMGYIEVTDPVAGRSVDIPYYNLHFMDHGSFSTDWEAMYPRVDPTEIAPVIGDPTVDVDTPTNIPPFAFWNAPNPFTPSGATEIVLSIPHVTGRMTVMVYDSGGRRVRDLFDGEATGDVMRFRWDGRTAEGAVLGAGVYHCRVKVGDVVFARKLTLVN